MGKIDLRQYEVHFLTGSQHLYGDDTLRQVAQHAQSIVADLNDSGRIALKIVWQPTVKTADEITAAIMAANASPKCVGVIAWMHTFSPAKMWINGLKKLQKPLLHLHTQFNRDIPWGEMDMDFMNLNQAAHGDREFGFICTRMGIRRKIVCGFYQNESVQRQIDIWCRVAAAWQDSQTMKIARLGDNMREVAVTEGDKVAAQIAFGYSVNGYGVSDVVKLINAVTDKATDELTAQYLDSYQVPDQSPAAMKSIREAARQELGMRAFLEDGGFSGFTTTFEDLAGFHQLPGLASQRLMADGYGFGAEGDWKSAALLRTMKVMADGLPGGVSFMEDYTYHLEPGRERILGAHMLEVCPTIAAAKPTLEVHPLGIGGKAAPARLVFGTSPARAINASMIELADHFRLLVNEVEVVRPDQELPKLPVARTVWIPRPQFAEAARLWIKYGGAHHSIHAPALTSEYMQDFARMSNSELALIH